MAGITLEQANTQLAAYLAAEEKILLKQRVVLNGQELTFADLAAVQAGVTLWNGRCQQLARVGGLRVAQVIPR